jgi:hypothetical protein
VNMRPTEPTPINLHAFPGRPKTLGGHSRQSRPERLHEHQGLVLVAAAHRYVTPEAWGLGVALRIMGRTTLGASLVVADDIAPSALATLRAWGASELIDTPTGPNPVDVVTRSQFFDYRHGLFTRVCYTGRGWLLTADCGRTLGLCADDWAPARGWFADGFTLGLPTWGAVETREGRGSPEWRALLHRPPMRAKTLGPYGVWGEFMKAGRKGMVVGSWEDAKGKRAPFRGRIVDLIGPAFAFDGVGGRLSDHLKAFGLGGSEPPRLPTAVTVDTDSAAQLLTVARATHELAITLDNAAASRHVDLRRMFSPGGLSAATLRATGIVPPLVKFPTPDDVALNRWSAAGHGGWVTADIRGELLPAVDIDIRSAYPAAFETLGCFDVLCARSLRHQDVTDELRSMAEQAAAGNLVSLFDPATYRRMGLCLAEIVPDGEPWPVERSAIGDVPSTLTVEPVWCEQASVPSSLPFAWPDVILAALLSGRVPNIVRASRLVPVGRQSGLSPTLRSPVLSAVRRRARAKLAGDDGVVSQLRLHLNAMAWGNFARLDQTRTGERTSEWTWPPVATSLTALCRLWLAMVDRMVTDQGGAVITRDTDGMTILATPEAKARHVVESGSSRARESGSSRTLSWADIEVMLRPFDQLDPFADGGAFWKVETGERESPLHVLSLALKRYVKAARTGPGWLVVGGTESGLGSDIVRPPGFDGHDESGRQRWTLSIATYAIERANAVAQGATFPDVPCFVAPWDTGDSEHCWPYVVRYGVGSWGVFCEVPDALRAHPFAPLVEGRTGWGSPETPRTLDPGTDLIEWGDLEWHAVVGPDQIPVRADVSVVLGDDFFEGRGRQRKSGGFVSHKVILRTLGAKGDEWGEVRDTPPGSGIRIDPRLITRVGRSGVVIDAQISGVEQSDAESDLKIYDRGDRAGFVRLEVARLGSTQFSRRYKVSENTAEGIAKGRTPSVAIIEKVMRTLVTPPDRPVCAADGCNGLVLRDDAVFCSASCRKRTKAKRYRAKVTRRTRETVETRTENVA